MDPDVVRYRVANCPECEESALYYAKRQVEILEGTLTDVVWDKEKKQFTPVLHVVANITEDIERVDCNDCGAGWTSWEEFLKAFMPEDHENDCVTR